MDGANTNLWRAFSQDVKIEDGGRYVIPYGRWHRGQRLAVELWMKWVQEGGTGDAEKLFEWCEKKSRAFESR